MEYALKMNDIHKGFGGVPVLKGVDFNVETGKIHALLGENGAGKTTLMNILGGVISMDSGSIELFGNQVVAVVLGNLLQLAQGGDLDARVEDDFADGDGEGVEVGREGGVVEVEVGVGGHEKTSFGMR